MTSPSQNDFSGLDERDWQPSKVYQPIPALIIPCGEPARFDELKRAVHNRLNRYESDGIIRWMTTLKPSDPLPQEKIANCIAPMMDLEFWQAMLNRGQIKYIPDAIDHPMQLRFVVICDLLIGDYREKVAEWLSRLAEIIKSTAGERVKCSIMLLVLGSPPSDAGKLSGYWPRFYIADKALGEAQVGSERINEVCQNIITYSTLSEFISFIDYFVDDKKKPARWIALGASAILVDEQAIKNRLEPEILKDLLEPFTRGPLTDIQKDLLSREAMQKARRYRGKLLINMGDTAPFSGWKIAINNKKLDHGKEEWDEPAVVKNEQEGEGCYLSPAVPLAGILFGDDAAWWLDVKKEKDQEKKPNINPTLKLYEKLFIKLKFWWQHVFLNSIHRFLNLFHPISIPDFQDKEENLAQAYQELYADVQRKLDEIEESEFKEDLLSVDPLVHWAAGLQAIIFSIQEIAKTLKESPVFTYSKKGVHPAPFVSEEYFTASVQEDIGFFEGEIRRYRRFQRSLLTWKGFILKLVVAWPLLTELINILTHWPQIRAALVSLGILIVLGLIELIIWRVRDRQKLMELRSLINDGFTRRVLSLLAKSLNGRVLQAEVRLYSIQRSIVEFSGLLAAEYQQAQVDCDRSAQETVPAAEGTLFWLTDYTKALGTDKILVEGIYAEKWKPLVNEVASVLNGTDHGDGHDHLILSWKSEARRKANADASQNNEGKFDKYESCFLDKAFKESFAFGKSVRRVLDDLKQTSQRNANDAFRFDELLIYVLAEQNQTLQTGLKWKWLYQSAHPLGGVTTNSSLATAIIAPGSEVLSLGTGQNNEYWPMDARVVTCPINEIGCIRAVVEWD